MLCFVTAHSELNNAFAFSLNVQHSTSRCYLQLLKVIVRNLVEFSCCGLMRLNVDVTGYPPAETADFVCNKVQSTMLGVVEGRRESP